jgi:hypothetical protein
MAHKAPCARRKAPSVAAAQRAPRGRSRPTPTADTTRTGSTHSRMVLNMRRSILLRFSVTGQNDRLQNEAAATFGTGRQRDGVGAIARGR